MVNRKNKALFLGGGGIGGGTLDSHPTVCSWGPTTVVGCFFFYIGDDMALSCMGITSSHHKDYSGPLLSNQYFMECHIILRANPSRLFKNEHAVWSSQYGWFNDFCREGSFFMHRKENNPTSNLMIPVIRASRSCFISASGQWAIKSMVF